MLSHFKSEAILSECENKFFLDHLCSTFCLNYLPLLYLGSKYHECAKVNCEGLTAIRTRGVIEEASLLKSVLIVPIYISLYIIEYIYIYMYI